MRATRPLLMGALEVILRTYQPRRYQHPGGRVSCVSILLGDSCNRQSSGRHPFTTAHVTFFSEVDIELRQTELPRQGVRGASEARVRDAGLLLSAVDGHVATTVAAPEQARDEVDVLPAARRPPGTLSAFREARSRRVPERMRDDDELGVLLHDPL